MSVHVRRYALTRHVIIYCELIERAISIKKVFYTFLFLICRYYLLSQIERECPQSLLNLYKMKIKYALKSYFQ